jgi:4-amino-4-deoxy-L-arabinose transferase-like glycosyltransferase
MGDSGGSSAGDVAVARHPPGRTAAWAATLVAALSAALVVFLFVDAAAALVRYPWDWSPDEGLYLDYARRLLQAPGTLYQRGNAVPLPDFYGPLLPLLLTAPVAGLDHPLPAARVIACLWSLMAALAIYRLVRRVASGPVALLAAVLPFAPFGLSFWWLIVRPDGPLVALWLWLAVALAPARLERGGDVLSRGRLVAACALLTLACLTKPTAVALGTPLVLGWWLVDRASFKRCVLAVAACGGLALAALTLATSGGYLWVMTLWRTHPSSSGLLASNLSFFAQVTAPLLVFTAAGGASLLARRGAPIRDPAILLLAGAASVVPALGKTGAMCNSLLPLVCALAVLGGRWWGGQRTPAGHRAEWAAVGLGALAAALMVARQPFPKPGPAASAAAEAFYGSLEALVGAEGGRILAIRPEYAYFAVGQPVEAEGSSFSFLLRGHVPGTRQVVDRLASGGYSVAAVTPDFVTPVAELADALRRRYVPIGACALRYFYGSMPVVILVPEGSSARFDAPAGSGCRTVSAGETGTAR